MISTENTSQDFECGRDLKGLSDNACNEVARLLRDYPTQSKLIYEETTKLAVALGSLIARHQHDLSGSSVTTLPVTNVPVPDGDLQYRSANLLSTIKPSAPVSFFPEGQTENTFKDNAFPSPERADPPETVVCQEQSLEESAILESRLSRAQSEPRQSSVSQFKTPHALLNRVSISQKPSPKITPSIAPRLVRSRSFDVQSTLDEPVVLGPSTAQLSTPRRFSPSSASWPSVPQTVTSQLITSQTPPISQPLISQGLFVPHPLSPQSENPQTLTNQRLFPASLNPQFSTALPPQDGSKSFILYDLQDDLLRLYPTSEQWARFPALLKYAKELGVGITGVCKVVLPSDIVSSSRPIHYASHTGYGYRALSQDNGTFRIERFSVKRSGWDGKSQTNSKTAKTLSDKEALNRFESLLHDPSGLDEIHYCVDMDAQTRREREVFGISISPIWPLEGDRLCETSVKIPGLHWPFFYEAFDSFGAPFAMHREIGDLLSINYLWEGDKYWITVPPSHAAFLEQKSKGTNEAFYTADCAQTLQHSATWYPVSTLEEWEIPYTVVHQRAGEVVITFPQVYHQGFSAGYTFAEAVNYADADWNLQGYRGCKAGTCPFGSVRREMLESQGADDERLSDDSAGDATERSDRSQLETSPTVNRTRSMTRKINTPVKRSVPLSSPASIVKAMKRKSSTSRDTPQKMAKLDSTQQNNLALLKGLSPIPKESKQPKEVFQIFCSRCKDESQDTVNLLTRLFFAVASPTAFYQLRDACTASRQDEIHRVPRPTADVLQTLQALDKLDTNVSTASILRRYHLTYLAACRRQKEEHIQSGKRRVPRKLKYGISSTQTQRAATGSNNDNSSAIAAMMKETYPSLAKKTDEYQKMYQSLVQRMRRGRNWYRLQQRLSPGILALVPTGGELDIYNSEIEKLNESSFESFLDVIVEFRGNFLREVGELVSPHIPKILKREDLSRKYAFESMDASFLKMPLDSENLVEYCRLEDDS